MSAIVCWNCGTSLDDIPRPISRHSQCSKCFNELHCCRLCRHFDPARTTDCYEDRADPPLEKENANFCEFFSPKGGVFERKTIDRSDSARGALGTLFGEDEMQDSEDATESGLNGPANRGEDDVARKKLDDLFKS